MTAAAAYAGELTLQRRRRAGSRILSFVKGQPLGALGLFLIIALAFLAAFGPLVTPEDPNAVSAEVLRSPSSEHWFGTDNFGRDYFSRIIAGARVSISIAFAAIAIGVTGGVVLGMASAYAGGIGDLLVQRLVDTMLALPSLILAMFFISLFGSDIQNLILVLSITMIPPVSRVARASALAVMGEPYIDAARVVGAPAPRLLVAHVLPNIAAPIVVIISTGIGALILAEAGLSFLGMGITPPTAEWGQMLSQSRTYALDAPWLAIFPGAAISIAVLAFNLFGDAIRDVWDPRLRMG
jgi:peptide/nickel transport system permease protein